MTLNEPCLQVTSYNVLAQSYARPERYPNSSARALEPSRRTAALVDQIAELGGDLICLQEVERDVFDAVARRLEVLGYGSQYVQKRGGRPDGCATFFTGDRLEIGELVEHVYRDGLGGSPDSGHVAAIALLRWMGRGLMVANTHLRWDPPATPVEHQIGYRQAVELLDRLEELGASNEARIVCGDFNAEPSSDLVTMLLDRGFVSAHLGLENTSTSNANQKAKTIDYLLHTAGLECSPVPMPHIEDRTPLPSLELPSDHLPVRARYRFLD